jgi:hypothetical protein
MTTAIPVKFDDTSKLKAEGKKFVEKKLHEFSESSRVGAGDATTEYFEDLLTYIKKAQTNNVKLTKEVNFIVNHMKEIVAGGIGRIASTRLHAFTALILGNQDNVSYYVLDYSAKWIDRRLPAVTDPTLKSEMESIKVDIETARDYLNSAAGSFHEACMVLKRMTGILTAPADSLTIKSIIDDLSLIAANDTLIVKTNSAVNKITQLTY